jgi:hypothetical protein
MAEIELRTSDLQRLARDFRAAGRRDLQREMLREMRQAVRPIVPQVKAAIRATPSRTGDQRTRKARAERPRSLRDAMARGVQARASLTGRQVGVRIRIDPRHFPEDEKSLPRYHQGVRSRWRSRNWGRDEWKTQRPYPVFFETIRPHVPRVQSALRRIVNDYTDRLTRETTS